MVIPPDHWIGMPGKGAGQEHATLLSALWA